MPLTQTKTFQRIYSIGTYFLVNPNWDFQKNEPKTVSVIYRTIFFLSQATFYSSGYIYGIYKLITSFLDFKRIASLHLLDAIITVIACLSIFWSGRDRKWHKILHLLTKKHTFNQYLESTLKIYIIMVHIPMLIVIIGITYPLIEMKIFSLMTMYRYFSSVFCTYIYHIYIAVTCCILITIREQLIHLKIELRNRRYKQTRLSLKNHQTNYREILEISETFNRLFGINFLLIIFMLVSKFLSFINTLIIEEINYTTITSTFFVGIIVMVLNQYSFFTGFNSLYLRSTPCRFHSLVMRWSKKPAAFLSSATNF